MAEVGVSVAAQLAEYLVHPTLQQLQYLFCVGKISRNVEIRKEELILKQGRVQERVQEAINRTDRIDGDVDKWKNDVKSIIAEVENLEEQLRVNNDCLQGWCPTWTRYRLCKKLANRIQIMIHLNTKSDHFNPFSHPVPVPDIEYHSSQNFKLFNSTRAAFDQLQDALNDDGSSIIGLWGMGGSGKTTLVTEVGKKVKESKHFDRVVRTTVSQNPNIRKIQGEIADTLGLEFKEESEIGRAKRIALRLQNGERNLVILDDVWAKLDLEDIGIPFGENHQRRCKVVLTTRRREVCNLMECQKMIHLGLLEEEEAWTLFQTHAHVNDGAKDSARKIVVECKGLPIAIVAMGTCLKGKGVDEMKVMLYRLRNAKPNNVDKGVRDAFACLELSYDYLATLEAKLLLLMCSMFPEDHKIDVEDLFRNGVGLGLWGDIYSFKYKRGEVRATIKYLIDSSLLMIFSPEFSKGREYVIMHDVVRDFALWKASKEDHTIIINCTKEMNKLIDDEGVKDCYAASSWYDKKNFLFPSQLITPKLKLLMLRSIAPLEILPASFEDAKGLQALIIMSTYRATLELQPQSIQWLSNLRSLRLQMLHLCDISFVTSLTRLEILDLQESKFERIPVGIEKLKKLKLLDLSNCLIDECCCKIIERCSQLEELYAFPQFLHSGYKNCYEFLAGHTGLRKLRRFMLEFGNHSGSMKFDNGGTGYLCLGQLNMSMLGSTIKDLAQRATDVEFNELKGGSKSFMPNVVQTVGGMNELTYLHLQMCSETKYIIDETTPHEDTVVPRLDELVLSNMNNLKQLHRGPSPFSFFQKLKRLTISCCPKLLHIFPADCNLGDLRFLRISHCPMLTSLFSTSIACTLFSLEELIIEGCDELKHVVEGEGNTWENSSFAKLKFLYAIYCKKLEFICPIFLAIRFVQLQQLSIRNAPKMKFVFDEGQPMHDQDETQILLPLLEDLQLADLPSLIGICSERYRRRWPSIKTIGCSNCTNMELHEFKGHQVTNEELYKPLATIETIRLSNCVAESIFHHQIGVEEQIPTFQYLKELILRRCGGLKFVFYAHICQSLPELISVTVSCCEELEAIFSGNEETQKNLSIAGSCLPKLKYLQISRCDKLKFVLSLMIDGATSMLPQLSTLTISNCSQMEEVFKFSNIEDHDIDSGREITFQNMKDMKLENLPKLVNVCSGFKWHIEVFCKVKVHGCPKLMPLKGAATHWTKEIDIQNPIVNHKWRVVGDDDQQETNDSGTLMESEQQMVGGGIVPTQVLSFQYLYSLEVVRCVRLKFLFSASIIAHNSLPKLTSLTLTECEELEEIVAENGEHQTVVLSSLRTIELKNLPNFKSVSQGRLQVKLMSDIISINNCPKFVDSSLGSALQQLETISVSNKDSNAVETSSSNNVNEERGVVSMISSAKELYLKDLMSLISVWESPTSIIFQNLRSLSVIGCRKLKCIFPNSIIKNLPCLERLHIEECEELEELMSSWSSSEEEHHHYHHHYFPNDSSNPSLCFPQLRELLVFRCGKLKWLFPSLPSTQHLPQLVKLTIKECSQLKGLFNNGQVEIYEEEFNIDNILAELIYFEVKDCPIFSKTTLVALESWWERRWIREI